MKRNHKNENLIKLNKIEINGFKVDIVGYLYNSSYNYNYPSLIKIIEKTDETIIIVRLYYFKYYDGSGKYFKEIYTVPNNKKSWNIQKKVNEEVLSKADRFNLNQLLKFAEIN